MIRVSLADHIGTITLARADRRNALTPEMLASLVSAIQQITASDARVILLTGEGSCFCAGFDLTLCRDQPDGSVLRALLTGLADAVQALRAQPRPVFIAAHGAAIAGGCALLGAADFVLTDDTAKLGYPVVRLGLSPAVSAPFLRLRVGDAVARELLLNPRVITGVQAAACGLATRSLATREEVLPAAAQLARELADKPPEAIAATRAWLAEVEGSPAAWQALKASLSLTGGDEERRMLPLAWTAT